MPTCHIRPLPWAFLALLLLCFYRSTSSLYHSIEVPKMSKEVEEKDIPNNEKNKVVSQLNAQELSVDVIDPEGKQQQQQENGTETENMTEIQRHQDHTFTLVILIVVANLLLGSILLLLFILHCRRQHTVEEEGGGGGKWIRFGWDSSISLRTLEDRVNLAQKRKQNDGEKVADKVEEDGKEEKAAN